MIKNMLVGLLLAPITLASGLATAQMGSTEDRAAMVAKGEQVFANQCEACHGRGIEKGGTHRLRLRYKGAVTEYLKDRDNLSPDYIRAIVRKWSLGMAAVRPTEITDEELEWLVAYLTRNNQPPNFLMLVADDLGVTSMADWGINDRNASTMHLDRLAQQGMRFDQFWSQPVCSPMRVSTLTGRYSFRHGVSGPLFGIDNIIGLPDPVAPPDAIPSLDFTPLGMPVRPGQIGPPPGDGPPGPNPDELFLPAVLKSLGKGYTTAAFGKWHMASHNNGAAKHPNLVGFDHFSGPIDGVVTEVSAWLHVENGEARHEFGYVDQKSADDATAWISRQTKPWMVWFSFINPHEPFHKPPVDLIQTESLRKLDPQGMTNDNTAEYFRAMVEAMDSLSGEIIASIPEEQLENTYIIWLGDNGDEVSAYPPKQRLPNRLKTTTFQGGVHVPFIIKGPNIAPGTVNSSLAHVVDIFGTVIELAGGNLADIQDIRLDSRPFTDQALGIKNPRAREWNYTDVRLFAESQAIRNERYKLIRTGSREQLFDLLNDPGETINLVADPNERVQAAYAALSAQLEMILASEPKPSAGRNRLPDSVS